MTMPAPNTPLYSHPLPVIEEWLLAQGCQQDREGLHCWHVQRPGWQAELVLDIEQVSVRYLGAGVGGRDITRSFKYSLTREDVENAVFSGP